MSSCMYDIVCVYDIMEGRVTGNNGLTVIWGIFIVL